MLFVTSARYFRLLFVPRFRGAARQYRYTASSLFWLMLRRPLFFFFVAFAVRLILCSHSSPLEALQKPTRSAITRSYPAAVSVCVSAVSRPNDCDRDSHFAFFRIAFSHREAAGPFIGGRSGSERFGGPREQTQSALGRTGPRVCL